MNKRREYQISQDDLDQILLAIESARIKPFIDFSGKEKTPQDAANEAWKRLGDKMGFYGMSVRPSEKGQLWITAEPKLILKERTE